MFKFINDIKVAQKLPAVIILIGISIASIVAFVAYTDAEKSLIEVNEQNLISKVEVKQVGLENWLQGIQDDLIIQSQNPAVISAAEEFAEAWTQIEGNPETYLQNWYITQNPNPTGSKENLDAALDGSLYSDVHAAYHPYFRDLQRRNEYYDVFVFDTDGNLIYSVFKELDYATNLVSGEWSSTDLGQAFRAAKANAASGAASFFDFKPYGPSADAPASFISIPLSNADGNFTGVLAYQMPVGRLNEIMGSRGGLGETGQVYIVGQDGLLRSDLPLTETDDILTSSAVKKDFSRLSTEEATLVHDIGLNGKEVVRAVTLMEFMGARWAFAAEQEFSELVAPAREIRNSLIMQILFGAILIGIVGYLFSFYFTRPLSALKTAIEGISNNDFDSPVPETERRDEIGAIAFSLDALKTELQKAKALEKGQEDVVIHLSAALENLASGDLETRIDAAFPAEYESLKISFNGAVESLATSFQAVSSIQGIEASTGQISQIVGMINDIAFQTNLLALNAGVEAARAGEAGRGFAVVASEVRVLAQRCAEAADQIARLVEKSKTDVSSDVGNVKQAVDAIHGVLESVQEISGAVANISIATQEQSSGLTEINSAVAQLDQVTQKNAAMVEETKAASRSLDHDSDQLERHVRQFKLGSAGSIMTYVADNPAPASAVVTPVSNPVHDQQAALAQQTTTMLKPTTVIDDDWVEF
ncbi:MAG: methyl-accepting chemotaxis protein [Pseudomonadota bacterium]|nr:methyl-accepting chemotaxis protein [Pseudomonadota bacterium]